MHGRSFTVAAVQVSPATPSGKAGTVELLCEKVAEAAGNGAGLVMFSFRLGLSVARGGFIRLKLST